MVAKNNEIKRDTGVFLSNQIAVIIEERIQEKIYPANAQIPKELDLCAEFQVSRPTIRKALHLLEEKKLIFRLRSKGTFVVSHPELILKEEQFFSERRSKTSAVKVDVLQVAMQNDIVDLYQHNYFEEFAMENGCSVEQIYWDGWYAAVDNIVKLYAEGSIPDIFVASNDSVGVLARMGVLRPLDDFLDVDELNRIKERAQNHGLGAYIYDGKLYGYPWFSETRLLIYRKDHFVNAGIPDPCSQRLTHDSFIEVGKKLSNPDNNLYAFAYPVSKDPITLQSAMQWIIQRGGSLLRFENGRIIPAVEEEAFVEALTWYTDLAIKHRICPQDPSILNTSNIIRMLRNGEVSMMLAPLSVYKWLCDSLPDGDSRFGIAPAPAGPVNNFTFLGGMPICISSNCKKPELAWKLISYMNQSDNLQMYCSRVGTLFPIECYNVKEIRKNAGKALKVAVEALETAVPHTYPIGYNQCLDFVDTGFWQLPFPQILQMILRGELNVENATKFLSVILNSYS